MKTFKQIIAEVEEPKSPDEKRFKDKHVIQKTADANGNGDDVFKASNVKKDKSKQPATNEPGEDKEVYEAAKVDRLAMIRRAAEKVKKQDAAKAKKAMRDAKRGIKQDKDYAEEEVSEKKLTPAELKKREDIAKAIERENPGMDMSKKMAIATATAKKVAEEAEDLDEISRDTLSSYKTKASNQAASSLTGKGDVKTLDKRVAGIKRASAKLDKKNRDAARGVKEGTDNPPFTPDPKKKPGTNSDGTKTSPMSRARQLAKKALQKKEEVQEGYEKITPGVKNMAQRVHDAIKKGGYPKNRAHQMALDDSERALKQYHGKDWRKRLSVKEDVEITEAALSHELKVKWQKAGAELKKYGATKGGVDKKDFQDVGHMFDFTTRVDDASKGYSSTKILNRIMGMDTDVRDKMMDIVTGVMGTKQRNSRPSTKEIFGKYISEEVELDEALHPDHVSLHPHPTKKTHYVVGKVGSNVKGKLKPGEHLNDTHVDDLHDMGMKVKHEKKPFKESVDEAVGSAAKYAGKSGVFGGKYTHHDRALKMKGDKFDKWRAKQAKKRNDAHMKQDPKMAKRGYAQNIVDTGKAQSKATKKGLGKQNISWQQKNSVKRGKLPEQVEIQEAVIDTLQSIVKTKGAKPVKFADGRTTKVDAYTASAMMNVYNNLNSTNKKKFADSINKDERMFMKMMDFAMQRVK